MECTLTEHPNNTNGENTQCGFDVLLNGKKIAHCEEVGDIPQNTIDHSHTEEVLLTALLMNKRLCKVLMSGKCYLIVTDTEPYFRDVYDKIRNNEINSGTWTEEDETLYQKATHVCGAEISTCATQTGLSLPGETQKRRNT